MLDVLIIEDDASKLQKIFDFIRHIPGISTERISTARCSHDARVVCQERWFNVVILDIHLPRHSYEEPRRLEGLDLLSDIRSNDYYIKPGHVIGITGLPDVYGEVLPILHADLFGIVFYDAASEDWKNPLRRKMEYILSAETSKSHAPLDYISDVGIVCALRKELNALLRIDWGWQEIEPDNGHPSYWIASVKGKKKNGQVVATVTSSMGMPSTAVACCQMIERYRPRFMLMAGITAGIKGKVNIGDVICADPSWDWGSGKYVVEDGKPNFLPAPLQHRLNTDLRRKIERLSVDDTFLSGVRSRWPDEPPDTALKIHVGPLATGASVLSDNAIADGIKSHNRDLLGVEMESYALFHACEMSTHPAPMPLSLKSVCDFADPKKDNRFQAYAAYTSATIAGKVIEEILL